MRIRRKWGLGDKKRTQQTDPTYEGNYMEMIVSAVNNDRRALLARRPLRGSKGGKSSLSTQSTRGGLDLSAGAGGRCWRGGRRGEGEKK